MAKKAGQAPEDVAAIIEAGDWGKLSARIAEGVSVDGVVGDKYRKRTLLALACERGKEEVVRGLIAAGADVNGGKDRALYFAVLMGHEAIVRILLEAGAEVNFTFNNPDEGEKGMTVLMVAANYPKSVGIMELLLKHGADPNVVTSKGNSALTEAVAQDNRAGEELLLARGCRATGKVLLGPVYRGDVEQVRRLIKAGADVNVVGGKHETFQERTPLQGAIGQRAANLAFARSLKAEGKGDGPDVARLEGENAKLLEIIRMLVGAGADVNALTFLTSPLYDAARAGDVEVVELMLKAGADANAAMSLHGRGKKAERKFKWGDYERAAIHVAAEEGHADVVRALAAGGADVNKADVDGHLPVDYAERGGKAAVVKVLEGLGGRRGVAFEPAGESQWELNI